MKLFAVSLAVCSILFLMLVSLSAQQQPSPSQATEQVLWEFDAGG
jgi:hypothetical protein